ncbi:TraB/GumN family protein [Neorhizobium sp. DAR64860/K0K1]|uniref:TraB/GumN family protein n=1 Tax=Neorhizobium sp. DAR64860/K0K1 TaxID=3421955 RepID=UPI003D2CA461
MFGAQIGTAQALDDAPQCEGRNLLAELKAKNPQEYRRVVQEGKKIPNGRGIFWKIEKKGSAPSYLLGTMHMNDPRVLAIPDAARKAHRRAKVVVLESAEILDPTQAIAQAYMQPDVMMMPAGKRIEDFLTAEQREDVNSALVAKGAPLSAVNYLRPGVVARIISIPVCDMERMKKGQLTLDQQLAVDAVANNIPVKGLETFAEQYSAVNAMSLEGQVKGLVEAIVFRDQFQDILETLIELYSSRDLRSTSPFLRSYSLGKETMAADTYSEFETNVLTKRNHVMAARAIPFLAEGNAFIAVGALHLQGREGLIELLRKQGAKVTRIE